MTDNELYEMGFKVLADKLGASEVPRFIRQCQPGKGDYSVDRHKLLANQPDIGTIVKRIQDRQVARELEERARAKRFAAPQNEIKKMTDLEVCEIGNQILVDKLGVPGFLRFIAQCQELNGGYPRDLIENKEDAEERIKLYTAGLTLNPRMVEGYVKRGKAYSYIGEYDKAITDYSEAVKIKPNYAEVYYNRGKLYDETDEHAKAIKDFSMVIKLEPKHTDAHGYRAALYRDKGEYDKAIEDFSMEIELQPEDPESYYDRGNTYGEIGEYDKAIEDYSKAVELAPKFTEAYVKRGLGYFQIGKFECAIRDYDKVLELKPKFIEVYAARGIIYLHVKKWENAKMDLTFATNLRVDIIKAFHKLYESVEDFEQKNNIQLPKDIAVMLTF
jgi:tetratricopeptide (TPR) repeat protein